jgi:hypothetical protein
MSLGPMFTTLQPMLEAELRARVWFSAMVKLLSLDLLIARSSIVPGTDLKGEINKK